MLFSKKYTTVKRVLFYRDFQDYSGGHQKVADYFNHLQSSNEFQPDIAFSPDSLWDNTNPWFTEHHYPSAVFTPENFDYLFLAGMDWQNYLQHGIDPAKPVISLIQHVRHANPEEDVYPFLSQKAIRICVSGAVEDAILYTGKVNGPVFTIPNGHEVPDINCEKQFDVFISGLKQPELAKSLVGTLQDKDFSINYLPGPVPRREFCQHMAESRIALLLPHGSEGFYLPALEAMKLTDITIVPDCIGNRSFCSDFRSSKNGNCLMPDYDEESLVKACVDARQLLADNAAMKKIRRHANKTLTQHTLKRERKQFLKIMGRIGQLW